MGLLSERRSRFGGADFGYSPVAWQIVSRAMTAERGRINDGRFRPAIRKPGSDINMVSCNTYLPIKSTVATTSWLHSPWTLVIAAGKFIYGVLLVSVGLGVFNLVGKNLGDELWHLINRWHIDTHLYYVSWLIHKVSNISNSQLILLTQINFIYAALSFIEAFGLAFEKRWAKWLAIVDTSTFIPMEIYQLYHAYNWINLLLLLAYVLTVCYLIKRLRQTPAPPANASFLSLTLLRSP
jgi:uncharacterized membrane protein (DUF2068 family)